MLIIGQLGIKKNNILIILAIFISSLTFCDEFVKFLGLKKKYCSSEKKIYFIVQNTFKNDTIALFAKIEKLYDDKWGTFCADIFHREGLSDMVIIGEDIKPNSIATFEFDANKCFDILIKPWLYEKDNIEKIKDEYFKPGKYRFVFEFSRSRKAMLGRTFDEKIEMHEFEVIDCKK
jgi:hypothetical protein